MITSVILPPTGLTSAISDNIDAETRLLAAIAYGEASTEDNPDEIAGIAHATVNRAKAWGKLVSDMITADSGYTYAANGTNQRFNLLKTITVSNMNNVPGTRIAVNAAKEALAGQGIDPSNSAFWWDGLDLKELRSVNARVK